VSFNNAVYGDNGRVVGFRCDVCDQVKTKMWGTVCNACRAARDNACEADRVRTLEQENAKLRGLAAFGLAVLEESRCELADLDGGWIQDKAQELGLLMSVPVAEPCGENCHCAEYGDFPQDCLRYSEDVKRIAEILGDG
jgi:hypothetical protein